jgi:23S rRNA (adenine2503-C2)-methyltransferase
MSVKNKLYLAGLLPEEISCLIPEARNYRSTQIFQWIHKPVSDVNAMTNLPLELRRQLREQAVVLSSRFIQSVSAKDRSVKYKIQLEDKALIEAVLLYDRSERITSCLSTQAGCAMGCTFCATARMGFIRNLVSHEIVEQFLLLKSQVKEISHIVFMGMGEPLCNVNEVRKAIQILHHPAGSGISYRKMTISTCGYLPGIQALTGQGPYVRLAFSLITADPQVRSRLLPSARSNPLPQIKKALENFQKASAKRITLEIVILPGINDRERDLDLLKDFAGSLKAVINLIPWNKVEDLPFLEPTPQQVAEYASRLKQRGLKVSERYGKGKSINAACGQLCILKK